MKTNFFTLVIVTLLTIATSSCSKDEQATTPTAQVPTSGAKFTATIGSESFATNDTFLATVSAGETQAFTATGTNGRSFSSAIFPSQFPINQAVNIAYSPSISYTVGNVTYIAKSGTMTFSIIDPYQRLKGVFTGVFVGNGGAEEINISGQFDITR